MELHGTPAICVAAAMIGVLFAGSTVFTPLYVIYKQQFGFSQISLTLIYAVYVLGNFAALLLFGRLSDEIGRRKIAVTAICGGERDFRLSGNLSHSTPQRCTANLQSPLFPAGKDAARKEYGRLRRLLQWTRTEVFSHRAHLLCLFGSSGYGFTGSGKLLHEYVGASACRLR